MKYSLIYHLMNQSCLWMIVLKWFVYRESTSNFTTVVMARNQLFRKTFLFKVTFIISFFNQFDCLTISSFITLVNTNNPTFTSKGFSEIMKLKIFIARINITNIIITFRLSISSIYLPCTIIAQSIHQTIFHWWKNHIVNSVSVFSNVIFLLNMRINTTSNTNHP